MVGKASEIFARLLGYVETFGIIGGVVKHSEGE
jgi:hypothetical protein